VEHTEVLSDIEAIKVLKARYCRFLDAKDWTAWSELFADDFVSDLAEIGGATIVGADEFVVYTRRTLGRPSQPTVHHVHTPEIALTSATTGRGVWALNDVVRLAPGVTLHGYGHYHETYEKTGDHWRIKSSKLTRLREDIATPFTRLLPQRVATLLRVSVAKFRRRTDNERY
jgi:hypothetical protein